MQQSRNFLKKLGFPNHDMQDMPTSRKRFPDGAQYRIELPSTEGPKVLEATLKELDERGITVHRISQGSGIMLQTDEEILEMCSLTAKRGIGLSLFVGPRGTWDVGAQSFTSFGSSLGMRHEGVDQLVYAMEDLKRGAKLGLRGALIADEGILQLTKEMKKSGDLPEDFVIKASVQLGASNPVSTKIIEDLGADTYNVPTALTLSKLASIRQSIDIPIDIYIEVPDNLGGFIRYYEIPEIIRVLAPVYIKFGLSKHQDVYPSGKHLEHLNINLVKERVRRTEIGLEMIKRYYPEAITSSLGAKGLEIASIN